MIDARFQESPPGQAPLHKYVGPEWRRGGAKLKRWEAARDKEIAQIPEEDPMPRRQLEEQSGGRVVLLGLDRWRGRGHISSY